MLSVSGGVRFTTLHRRQTVSSSSKPRRKVRRKKAALSLLYPDTCFCDSVPRSPHDEFVRKSGPMFSIYDYCKVRPCKYPIRRCVVCGKEYLDAPAMA